MEGHHRSWSRASRQYSGSIQRLSRTLRVPLSQSGARGHEHDGKFRGDMNLHRYSLLVMILALLVILSGAYITSTEVAARQSQSAVSLALHEGLHRALAIAFVILTCGLAIWTTADT